MKGIAKNRCGYTGYTCTGIQKLDTAFLTKVASVDNYENVPAKVTGFSTSVDTIQDMDIDWSPEKSCWAGGDVAAGGFLDLLTRYGNKIVYRAAVAGSSYVPYLTTLVEFYNSQTGVDSSMLPGLLEPPVVAEYKPSTTVDIPSPDRTSIPAFILKYIQALKCVIEDYLPFPIPDPDTCGIVDTIVSMADSDLQCGILGIKHATGKTLVYWEGDAAEPATPTATYSVEGGMVDISGHSVYVAPATFTAPFSVYLNTERTVDAAGNGTVSAVLSTEQGADSVLIGSVTLVRSDDAAGKKEDGQTGDDEDCPQSRTKYKMWRISQAVCSSSVTIPGMLDPVPDYSQDICSLKDLVVSLSSTTTCPTSAIHRYSGTPIETCRLVDKSPCADYKFVISGLTSMCTNCMFVNGQHDIANPRSTTLANIGQPYKLHRNRYDGYPVFYNRKHYLYHRSDLGGMWVIGPEPGYPRYWAYKTGNNPVGTWAKTGFFNFTLRCDSGSTIVMNPDFTLKDPEYECGSGSDAPYYTVSGFDVTVNGQLVHVPDGVDGSRTPIQAPFYIYLNVTKNQSGSYVASMSESVSPSALATFNIGGVSFVSPVTAESTVQCADAAKTSSGYPKYGVYAISQDTCPGSSLFVDDSGGITSMMNLVLDTVNASGCIEDVSIERIHVISRDTGGVPTEWKAATVPYAQWMEGDEEPVLPDMDWHITTTGNCLVDGTRVAVSNSSIFHRSFPVSSQGGYFIPFDVWLCGYKPGIGRSIGPATIEVLPHGTRPAGTESDSGRRWCTQIGSAKEVKSATPTNGQMTKTVKSSVTNCMDPIETSVAGYQTSVLLMGLADASIYQDFRIEKVSGPTMFYESQRPVSTIYNISGGRISVNGFSYNVAGGLRVAAPFKAWVEMDTEVRNGLTYFNFTLKAQDVANYPENVIQIGGVRQIELS